jgi:O-antigen/teichoic acid export membrane protein
MLKAILSDKFIKAGGILFLSSMVTNIFNYIFQITMGRLLSSIEYGLMNSLLAIFIVMGVPLGTILMVISKQTAEYKAKGELDKIGGLLKLTYKKVFTAGFTGLLLFLVASSYIKDYIHAPSVTPVVILGLCIFISLAPPINIAVLQGLQDFKWINIGLGFTGPLKFLFCLIMVLAGFSVSGVIGGLVLASTAIWAITYIPLKKDVNRGKENSKPDNINLMDIFHVLLANLAFAMMTQADMVLVKHFFSAHQSGIYASASILGKAVMYLPGALVLAMFPMVAESNALQLKSGHLIKKVIIVSLVLSGSGALLLFAFPELVIKTFFGTKYIEAVEVVQYFGVAMLPMALLMILMNYFIAKGKTIFSYILFLGTFIEIALILFFHGSLMAVIYTLMGIGGILLCFGFILLYLENKTEQRKRQHLTVKQSISPSTGK